MSDVLDELIRLAVEQPEAVPGWLAGPSKLALDDEP